MSASSELINSGEVSRPRRFAYLMQEYEETQTRLPYWARATNPIVRRHLGLYWRTIPPQLRPFVVGILSWAALLLVCFFIPGLLELVSMFVLAGLIIVPGGLVLYAHVLLSIAASAADAMQEEFRNNTLQLLRATPMSLTQIVLGKVAAAMWKRMDDLALCGLIVLSVSPPIFFLIYEGYWPYEEYRALNMGLVLLALLVNLLRLVLEPVMVGLIAVVVGMLVSQRSQAITTAIVLGAFYFVLLNVGRNLPAFVGLPGWIFIFDFVLPLLLPALLILGLLRLSTRILSRD